MIYAPYAIFSLVAALGGAAVNTAFKAATDFIAGKNMPWAYYLGVFAGQAAAATGIPGARSFFWVIGNGIDVTLFHSPDGSLARIYLDGIQADVIDLFAPAGVWQSAHIAIPMDGMAHQITIENAGLSPENTSGIAWLAIGDVTVDNGIAGISGDRIVADQSLITYGIQDAAGVEGTFNVFVPSTISATNAATYAQDLAAVIDPVLDGFLTYAKVSVAVPLPSGIKTVANTGAFLPRTGLLTFDLNGTKYTSSIDIPAFLPSKAVGDKINTSDTAVSALISALITGLPVGTPAGNAVARDGAVFTALKSGRIVVRKKRRALARH